MTIRSIRTSCRIANTEKRKAFQGTDVFVKDLKNRMSKYILENIQLMLDDYDEFIRSYNKFNDKEKRITAWETQALFHDTCKFYKNSLDRLKKNLDTSIQVGYDITYYKKKVTLGNGVVKMKGDVKSFRIKKKYTALSKFIKLLTFLDCDNLEKYKDAKFYDVILFYQKNKNWERILKVVGIIKFHMQQKLKCIEFTTGTYRKNLKGDEFIVDETNAEFKHWFLHKGHHYPLQLEGRKEKKYHKDLSKLSSGKNKQVFVKVVKDRVDFFFTYEHELKFKEQFKPVAIDINIKNNFCTTSDRQTIDYDRKYIQEFIDEIKVLDAIGYKNISESQRSHLERIIGKNEWYFKKLISEVLDGLEKDGVTDIVMEDLDNKGFAASVVSSEEFGQKYTRLIRLLRLGNIKTWMSQQAEKRGIRVHLTNPAYSSQECPKCHHIDRDNRPTQEIFKCVQCGHEDNADFVSPQNLLQRFVSDVLKNKLHDFDDFGRMIPKKLKRDDVKQILSSFSTAEHLCNNSKCVKHYE